MSSDSVCNHTRDKQNTCMITDRIGLHSVLLPLLILVEEVRSSSTVVNSNNIQKCVQNSVHLYL